MFGQLQLTEIESLLQRQCVGRIGCCRDNIPYVIPISYAYHDNTIYCHTYEGKKMEIMRSNPSVCFQVDEMKNMANWKSVIGWGQFEELTEPEERRQALKLLLSRQLPIPSSVTTHLGNTWPFIHEGANGYHEIPGLVFKITLTEKTGKFETTSLSRQLTFE